jgi:nucleoside-diphosphate-sugar epimerase
MTRQIIVTGGSGFLGRMVCKKLAIAGWRVHAWMRGKTELDCLSASDRILRYHIDIYDKAAVREAIIETGAKEMIHLAWGGLPNYLSCHHMDVELVNQIKFIRNVAENGITRMTLIGTCFEYGPYDGELREDMICNSSNSYGNAKLSLLRYVECLSSEIPFSYKWLRLFYMYGDGQGEKSLYTLFRAAYLRGDRSFEMSAGHQIRDFMAASDVVSKITALHAASVPDGIYNVCSGRPISVRQLIETWIKDWDYDVRLIYGKYPMPQYEPLAFWGNNSKTEKALGKST